MWSIRMFGSCGKMKVLALFLFVAAASAKHEQYAGWKSYFVGPQTYEQLQAVAGLESVYELDFIGKPIVGREGIVLVKPEQQAGFTENLDILQVPYRIHIEDVVAALRKDDEDIEARNQVLSRNGNFRFPYDNYQPLSVYEEYIDDVARRFPDRVTVVTPANSFEGRPIKVLKISTTNFEDTSKPIIFIDATIHAREWIAPPTVAWAIHKLLENVTEPDLLDRFDWILIPVANPDGYEFSFTDDRWWRKTRSTDSSILSTICPGVDGNRNYDFAWNTVGVSSNPCAINYAGGSPFSEIETRVIRDLLQENLSRIALYLTMHSFGSMILYPWGHAPILSDNAFSLQIVGVAMADAIFENKLDNFPRYAVGNSVLVIGYAASGASEDYAHSIGVSLSYTYELPGFGSSLQGFNPPPQYIEQIARETWEGIVAGARRAGDLF